MLQEPQQSPHTESRDRENHELFETCTGCGGDAVADPVNGGLNCGSCGQWHFLCDECMPNVSEHSRDAAWHCPECRDPTYH